MDNVEEKTVGSDMDWDATPDVQIQTTTTCGGGEVVGVATADAGQGPAEEKSTLPASVDRAAEKSMTTAAVGLAEEKSTLAAVVDLAAETSTLAIAMDTAAEKSAIPTTANLAADKSLLADAVDIAAKTSTLSATVDHAAEKSTIATAVDLADEKSILTAAVGLAAEKSTLAAAVVRKPAADAEMADIAPETTGVVEKNEVVSVAAGERKAGLEDKVERMAGEGTKDAEETTKNDSHRGQGPDVEHQTEDGASPVQGKSDVLTEIAVDEVTKNKNKDEVTSDVTEKGDSAVEAGQAVTSEDSQTESSVKEMKEESVHPNKSDNCAETVGDVETIRINPDADAEVVVGVDPMSETDDMEIEPSDLNLTKKADIAQKDAVETEVTRIEKDFSNEENSATKSNGSSTTKAEISGLADTDRQTRVDDEKASVKTSDCGSFKDLTIDHDPPHKPAEETVDEAGDEATTHIIIQAEASDIAGIKVNEAKPSGVKASEDEVDGPEAIEEDQLKLAKQRRELSECEGDDTKQPRQEAEMECSSLTTVPDDPANSERSAMNEKGASASNEEEVEKLKCQVMETIVAAKALSVNSDVASGLVNRENNAEEKADKATLPGEDVEEPGAKTSLPRTKRKLSSGPGDEADKAEHSHAQEKKSKIEDEANEQHRTENVTKESTPLIQDAEMSDVALTDKAEKAADSEKDKAEDQRMAGQPISATSCEQESKREDSEVRSPRASTSGLASRHTREERGSTLLDTVGWTGETVWKPATELCLSKLVSDDAVPALDLDAKHAPTGHAANGNEPVANGMESKLSPVPEDAMDASVSCEACLPKDADDSSGTNGEDKSPPTGQEAARESAATGVTEVSMESPDGTGNEARAAPSPGTAAGEEPRDLSGVLATGDSVPPEEAMQS